MYQNLFIGNQNVISETVPGIHGMQGGTHMLYKIQII